MKMRYLLACLAGLVPALLFLSAPAGAAPPQWIYAPTFLGARAPRLAAAPWRGTGTAAPGVAAGQHPWPQQKITASDWAAGDLYGYSAELTSNTAFVAAPHATIDGNVQEGAVYVYRKSHGTWTQVQKITPDDGGAYDEFGISISASGNTLLVGSVQHGGTGAAYVFKRTGGNWTQTQEFTASDGVGFGYVVALHGRTAVIGAPGVNGYAGAAYVFKRWHGAWSQVAELTASDGAAGDWFGQSVGISGNTILVGQFPPPSFTAVGAVYVFTKSGRNWSQTQKLTPSETQPGEGFGFALAVSGSTAVISAAFEQVGNFNFGAVYVFGKSGGTWTQTQKLIGSDDTGPNQFGNRVALHGDTAVAGVPVASFTGSLSFEGAAYVFTKSGGTWNREKILTAGDAAPGEGFGFAVGLSANGVLATSIPDYGGGAGPDAGYVFDLCGHRHGHHDDHWHCRHHWSLRR